MVAPWTKGAGEPNGSTSMASNFSCLSNLEVRYLLASSWTTVHLLSSLFLLTFLLVTASDGVLKSARVTCDLAA